MLIIMPSEKVIISQVERISPEEIGDPDLRLIEPFIVTHSNTEVLAEVYERRQKPVLTPWLLEYTDYNKFEVHSDKILTMTLPNNQLKDLYKEAVA
jgi:hypothetical protein